MEEKLIYELCADLDLDLDNKTIILLKTTNFKEFIKKEIEVYIERNKDVKINKEPDHVPEKLSYEEKENKETKDKISTINTKIELLKKEKEELKKDLVYLNSEKKELEMILNNNQYHLGEILIMKTKIRILEYMNKIILLETKIKELKTNIGYYKAALITYDLIKENKFYQIVYWLYFFHFLSSNLSILISTFAFTIT